MAAISAHEEGARVLVVDKGQLAKSGCSPNAHGGAALYHKHQKDNWRVHAEDTLMSGGFLNDQEVVRVLCTEGRKFVTRLEEYGALWDRDPDGSYAVRGGSHLSDVTGLRSSTFGRARVSPSTRDTTNGIRCVVDFDARVVSGP